MIQKNSTKLNNKERDIILKWKMGVKTLPKKLAKKKEKDEKLKELDNKAPPAYKKWTPEDEKELNYLKAGNVNLEDTVLGKTKMMKLLGLERMFAGMDLETQKSVIDRLKEQMTNPDNETFL